MQCAGIKYLCWQKACNRQLKIRDNEIEVCGERGEAAGVLQEQEGEGLKWVVVCVHGRLLLVLLMPHLFAGGPQPHRCELCNTCGNAEIIHRHSLRAQQRQAGVTVT